MVFKKLKKRISEGVKQKRIERKQVKAAEKEIRRKSRAAALRERQAQTIKTYVEKEKIRGARQREALRQAPQSRFAGLFQQQAQQPAPRTRVRRKTKKRATLKSGKRKKKGKRRATRRAAPRRVAQAPQSDVFSLVKDL